MFAAAFTIASAFTKPIIICSQRRNGDCRAGVGSFVVVNKEGWILTAAHILQEGDKLEALRVEHQSYDASSKAINSESLPRKLRDKRIRALGPPNPDWITGYSFWWGSDSAKLTNVRILPAGDIAVGRLDPFDPASVSTYPTFKKSTSGIDPGTSLCRLGFPFHVIKPIFENGGFRLPPETFPMPFFPNEGILTRKVSVEAGPPFIGFIETSSAGLMGQSGGPIFDRNGVVWGIQSQTRNLDLGFSPPVPNGKPGEREHQFLNVGMGTHPATIEHLLIEANVAHDVSVD